MSLDVLALLLVMAAALGGGAVARKLGYPTILGELLAGIILGPPLLGCL
jgi:Kef-type K+ transport system membrane component KefB